MIYLEDSTYRFACQEGLYLNKTIQPETYFDAACLNTEEFNVTFSDISACINISCHTVVFDDRSVQQIGGGGSNYGDEISLSCKQEDLVFANRLKTAEYKCERG